MAQYGGFSEDDYNDIKLFLQTGQYTKGDKGSKGNTKRGNFKRRCNKEYTLSEDGQTLLHVKTSNTVSVEDKPTIVTRDIDVFRVISDTHERIGHLGAQPWQRFNFGKALKWTWSSMSVSVSVSVSVALRLCERRASLRC
jgi:hypothetical protein